MKKKGHTHGQRLDNFNVYSPVITPAHMLASTNIHKHFKHTHPDTPEGPGPYCVQYLPTSRASLRGLFCQHKHHSKWFRKHQFISQLQSISEPDESRVCRSRTSGLSEFEEDSEWSTRQAEREAARKNKDDVKALSVSSKLLGLPPC